jgi:hypothetical protein
MTDLFHSFGLRIITILSASHRVTRRYLSYALQHKTGFLLFDNATVVSTEIKTS